MTRRTNLNTIRNGFNWESNWTTYNLNYTQLLWIDVKITAFLNGLFYVLRIPSSNYAIRRFFNNFVVIETDLWLVHKARLKYCVNNLNYFAHIVYKLRRLIICERKRSFRSALINNIYGIVYNFINKPISTVQRTIKYTLKSTDARKATSYDANTLRARSNSIFNINRWDILDRSNTWNRWITKRTKPIKKNVQLSVYWLNKQRNIERSWERTIVRRLKPRSNNSVYLLISRYFYRKYFFTSLKHKFQYHMISARRHKHMPSSLPFSDIRELCNLQYRYYSFCNTLQRTVNIAYHLRNNWHSGFSLRLITFYAKHLHRRSLIVSLNTKLSNNCVPHSSYMTSCSAVSFTNSLPSTLG